MFGAPAVGRKPVAVWIHGGALKYPPTMLVHGTADTDVPCEQSKMMAPAAAGRVRHQIITGLGGGHGL